MRALSSRTWVLAGVVAGVVLLAAAWLVVISPVRSSAVRLQDDTASVQTQNTVLLAKNNKLRDLATHRQQLVAELETSLSGLPTGAGLPVFSRQVATQAAARGLVLTGVTIGAATSPTTTTAAPASIDTSDAAASTDTATTGITASPAITSAMAIPVTITTTGPALQQLLFLRDVQQSGPRLALVTSSSLAPAQGAADASGATASIDASATQTLQLTVFTSPLTKATRQQLAAFVQSASKA